MRKLFLCLMLGLAVVVTGCSKDDESKGDPTSGDGGGVAVGTCENGAGTVDAVRAVTLDHIDGSPAAGQIKAGGDVVFHLRLKNTAPDKAKGITNGFRIFSPDAATWTTSAGDTTGTIGKTQFDLVFGIMHSAVKGKVIDTVGFGGALMQGEGLVPGFDDVAYTVTIGPIPASDVGKCICIDSTAYAPSGAWVWAYGDPGSFRPSWDGPHCFTVVE